MKKKTVITVVIGVIIALTIITSIYGKNPIYNYVKNRKHIVLGDAKRVSDAKHNIYFVTKFAVQYGGIL